MNNLHKPNNNGWVSGDKMQTNEYKRLISLNDFDTLMNNYNHALAMVFTRRNKKQAISETYKCLDICAEELYRRKVGIH